jgi:hypothetical protein
MLDILPEVDSLISKPLLFTVNGEEYFGHYHCNGWFYCDELALNFMALGNKCPLNGDAKVEHIVTSWRYLR